MVQKISFVFRPVSHSLFEVRPYVFSVGDQAVSVSVEAFQKACDDYVSSYEDSVCDFCDGLYTFPWVDDFFMTSPEGVSRMVRCLASIPDAAGFSGFAFLILDGGAFVIELIMDESVLPYFGMDQIAGLKNGKKQKEAA